jgi:CheY-like chemotaxis protein
MKHIMIIDDDPAVRDVLREIVSTFGYTPHPVDSAKDAVAMLTKGRIDLIFLDISMPEITGDQLLEFIRKKGFQTPVVVVSAHVDEEVEKRMRASGISGIIQKPFEVAEVIDQMEEAMVRRR